MLSQNYKHSYVEAINKYNILIKKYNTYIHTQYLCYSLDIYIYIDPEKISRLHYCTICLLITPLLYNMFMVMNVTTTKKKNTRCYNAHVNIQVRKLL